MDSNRERERERERERGRERDAPWAPLICFTPFFDIGGRGGGGAIKVEGVCQLVLPDVHMCARFEKGILRGRVG